MTRRSLRTFVSIIIPLGLVAAAFWLREEERRPVGPSRGSQPSTHSSPAPTARPDWVRLESPRLVEDPANDGDSFLIRHAGGTHVLRLYFVDCPEKRRFESKTKHQSNAQRLADQGAYFGGVAEADTLRLGREARDFTLHLLETSRIEIFTRWDPVFDERRHYAHLAVVQPDGSRRWLAELLVENGLARIFTRGADLPDGTAQQVFVHHLRTLEKVARLARRGGWEGRERERE